MRILIRIIAILLCTQSMIGCTDDALFNVESLPARITWDDGWCSVDAQGAIVQLPQGYFSPTPSVNGYFSAVDSSGAVTVFRNLDDASPVSGLTLLRDAGYFAGGLIPVVSADGQLQVADAFGRIRFCMSAFDGRRVAGCSGVFRCGLLSVKTVEGKWGAVDRNGSLVVPPIYDVELVFRSGWAIGVKQDFANGGARYCFVSVQGHESFLLPEGMYVEDFNVNNGKVACISHGKWLIVDCRGNLISLPESVKGVESFTDTYIIYVDSQGRRGLMNMSGEVVLAARYNSLEFVRKNRLLASNSQHYFLMDYRGRVSVWFDDADEVVSLQSRDVDRFESRFGFAVRNGSLWHFCDMSGERVGDIEFVAVATDLIYGIRELIIGNKRPDCDVLGEQPGAMAEEFVADSIVSVSIDSLDSI